METQHTPELFLPQTYAYIATWTALCAACNLLIKHRMKLTRQSTRAFYLVHSAMNAVICWLTWGDMLFTLRYPMQSTLCHHTMQGDCAPSHALFVMLGIHISHCLTDYATLTLTDYVHHALSCGMSGYFMLLYRMGAAKNFALFYSCGAPGMLSYLGLFCVKNGWLDRLLEKRISTVINQWVRGPMLFLMGYIVLLCHAEGRWEKGPDGVTNEMPLQVLVSMVTSVSLNGLYFSQQVSVSYGKALVYEKNDSLRGARPQPNQNGDIRKNQSFINGGWSS